MHIYSMSRRTLKISSYIYLLYDVCMVKLFLGTHLSLLWGKTFYNIGCFVGGFDKSKRKTVM